ncbi:hypothetical protein RhiirA5_427731, partial [Rhizophagus irregularis]
NQQFTAPIKHLRYKKKFIEPSKGYYTFPIPFPETKTVSAPAIADTICNDSSVASISNGIPTSSVNTDNWKNVPKHYVPLIPQSAIYEGGRLNQPSRMKIWKKKLQPLAVGSDGWLTYMKEIYDHHSMLLKYEQDRIIAGIKWNTTPDQGEYRKNLCNIVMEVTDAHHNYELKLLEMSIKVTPVVAPREDNEILENLRSWVKTYEDVFIIEYYRDEIGLNDQSCAIMDDRPLKRRADDNGNLDTHYGYHKDKKICILSTSEDLEISSSIRTL